MFLESSTVNSFVTTFGEASEADPPTAQLIQLKRLIGADSVGSYRSDALGPLCVIRLQTSDKPDLSFLEDDWAGNWFRRQFESVTMIHDPSIVAHRAFERLESEGLDRADRHITYLGISDVIAISLNPTDQSKRVVDTFEAYVTVLSTKIDPTSFTTKIAIGRAGHLVDPEGEDPR